MVLDVRIDPPPGPGSGECIFRIYRTSPSELATHLLGDGNSSSQALKVGSFQIRIFVDRYSKSYRADERDVELNWRESIIRLFWSCFLVECDRLAELELPRSGLQQLTDEISLPECINIDIMQSTCYLAEISIRRLLNLIHNSLYPKKKHVLTLSTTTLTEYEDFPIEHISMTGSICDELHSQLELWHSSIPEGFRLQLFIQRPDSAATDRKSILRIRYFAARHIIYRPFLLYIINHGMDRTTDYMIEKAALCIESCRYYIHSTTSVLATPSQYTWTFSLSYVETYFNHFTASNMLQVFRCRNGVDARLSKPCPEAFGS